MIIPDDALALLIDLEARKQDALLLLVQHLAPIQNEDQVALAQREIMKLNDLNRKTDAVHKAIVDEAAPADRRDAPLGRTTMDAEDIVEALAGQLESIAPPELMDARIEAVDERAFKLTFPRGASFLVMVTQVEEGE